MHSLTATDAAQADVTQLPALVHGGERAIYGDRAVSGDQSHTRTGPGAGRTPFLVVKRLWGFAKVRYRGLAKNTARAFALFALTDLYTVRYRLLSAGATCRL